MGTPRRDPATHTGVPLEVDDATLLAWLQDDLGPGDLDVTSDPLFPPEHQGRARIVTREPLVVSGLDEATRLLRLSGIQVQVEAQDAQHVQPGTVLAHVRGPTRAILRAERTALNLLCRASGIATLTHWTQKRVQETNPDCRVSATRKTTPGFRPLEKRAVLHGGGDPHRYGLYDMILIKDNHRQAGGDLRKLIEKTRTAHPGLAIEVEVESKEDAETAARAHVDWILVDNQSPETLQEIAALARGIHPEVRIEASGGIRVDNAHEWAPHADRVSLGALTQGAPAKDIGLDWD
jgi:nicotinate-nucleotide pyrophosphorylase (carboxylating)